MIDEFKTAIEKQAELAVPNTGGRNFNVHVDFKGDEASHTYGAYLTTARRRDTDKLITKAHLMLQHDKKFMCFNVNYQKPNIDPIPELSEVPNFNYNNAIEAYLYEGEDGCGTDPVVKVVGQVDVSDEMKQYVRDMVNKKCEYNCDFPQFDILTSRVYDRAHFEAEWTETVSHEFVDAAYFLYELIRGKHYDHFTNDYTAENKEHHIDVHAERNVHTKHWNVKVEKPHETTQYRDVASPMWFDIITFDQSHYHWQPSSCWTTLAADATMNYAGGVWARFHEGEWQVKGMWVTEGLTWEMTPTHFKLNGEEFTGEHESFSVSHSEEHHS